MRAFDYVQPATIDAAIKTLAERDTVCLAGGTNLLDLMKGNVEQPLRLVDITHLPLNEVEPLAAKADTLSKMLGGLIKYLKRSNFKDRGRFKASQRD